MSIRKNYLLHTFIALGIGVQMGGAAESIQNKWLTVSWNRNMKAVQLQTIGAEKPFFTSKGTPRGAGDAEVLDVVHDQFGKGRAIRFVAPSGLREQITLFEKLPFAVFDKQLRNNETKEAVVKKVSLLNGQVDLGVAPDKLATVSTAGLRGVAKHPGGYSFMAIGDPQTRNGVVCGWGTHMRGCGIVFADIEDGIAVVKARIDYGDLRLPPKSDAATETLLLGYFDDVRYGLTAYGDAIAQRLEIKLPPKPTVYCTWYHGGASNEKDIAKNADFVKEHLNPFGLTVMQIDDKWQLGLKKNGPRKNFTSHDPKGPYPSGMKKTADYFEALGLVPGIWFMPFAGTWEDPFFADKQDLFYQKDGKPYFARWGGTCIDMTNPKSRKFVGDYVRRISKQWGYKYFKMDGLWTGTGTKLLYVNSSYKDDDLGVPTRHNPAITPIEAYRLGFETIRKASGEETFYLGCCAPQNMRSFGAAMGMVQAMRVGPDNGANPKGLIRGPQFASRVFFLNGRVWYNDPDPVYVRPSFPTHMAQTSVSWTALSGSLHSSSYSYYKLPPDRLDILKRSMPSHGLKTVWPVDYLEQDVPRVWLLTDDRRKERHDVVGLFNWNINNTVQVEYPIDRIGLPKADAYVGFDYWANQFVPPFSGKVSGNLLPGGCRILSLRPVADRPLLVGTSRHLTQGAVDLVKEEWGGTALRGTSNVIAGDSYELRIVVPVGKKSWKLSNVVAKGVKSTSKQVGPTIRVRFEPTKTGTLDWEVQFEPAPVVVKKVAKLSGLTSKTTPWDTHLSWTPDSEALIYRITRTGGGEAVTVESTTSSYHDTDVSLGATYTYVVQGRNWSGDWSAPASVKAQMPREMERPATPPMPTIRCDKLKPKQASVGWGRLQINKSVSGKALTLDGKKYDYGIGVHAPSKVVYRIPKGAKRFVAVVGIDDAVKKDARSSIMFKVVGDVKEMGEPPVILGQSPAITNKRTRTWAFNIELDSRFREIQLIVSDAGDGKAADHANWVNVGFTK